MEKPITKKAQHAAAVAERKWTAWRSRVRVLTGHMVYDRVHDGELVLAYHANVTADAFAVTLAAREPVGKALHPAKVDAVKSATEAANATIERVRADLEAHGWDLEKAAPYPDSRRDRTSYKIAVEKYHLYSRLTEGVGNASRRPGTPNIVEMSDDGKASFIKRRQEQAAFEYDAFICKMVQKVGD